MHPTNPQPHPHPYPKPNLPKTFYQIPPNNPIPASCNKCLQKILGDRIDVEWDIKQGTMKLTKSPQNPVSSYQRDEKEEVEWIRGAYFFHGENCPFQREDVVKNDGKFVKPCACVMLYDNQTNQILITERSPTLRTYPNAWVLPGGHLEPGQGIFQGGIRQCQQQVGLPPNTKTCQPVKQLPIMIWQSVFTIDKQIKACAMVVFFIAYCQQFDVKIDHREVSAYKWKDINDKTGEKRYSSLEKCGYAEGHLKYLELIRNFIQKQQEKGEKREEGTG